MAWDGKHKAPKGKFRLIGEDTFKIPPEDHLVGDYDSLKAATDAAKKQAGPMHPVLIFDDTGKPSLVAD